MWRDETRGQQVSEQQQTSEIGCGKRKKNTTHAINQQQRDKQLHVKRETKNITHAISKSASNAVTSSCAWRETQEHNTREKQSKQQRDKQKCVWTTTVNTSGKQSNCENEKGNTTILTLVLLSGLHCAYLCWPFQVVTWDAKGSERTEREIEREAEREKERERTERDRER
jgi:hypothetical protein